MLKLACIVLLAIAAQPRGGHAMSGGEVVSDASTYSFQAAIQPRITQGGTAVGLNLCSGVIIQGSALNTATPPVYADKYYILTSATCLLSGVTYDLYLGTNEVRGVTTPDIAGITRADVTFHPEALTSGMQKSDLAIISADAITTFYENVNSGKRLTSASLPSISTSANSYLTNSVNMAGWGYPYDSFGGVSPRLRQLNSRVVPNWYCSVINFGKPVSSKHICTGGLINKGPCTGDAGAPLIHRGNNGNRVIGLATLVPASGCQHSKPGVFTRLGNYLTWIMQVTNYNPDD
ncbi:brachyurin-like isoform X2 [Thrips palmi]|uniref:Brachyurin-like isoform X2 n=1 Tax=Thrips palmi TaxID=161013 RepID=A0A6P8ZDK1_THRPL|nr:brachyurin-like isoform X2 [Thrips palmi]